MCAMADRPAAAVEGVMQAATKGDRVEKEQARRLLELLPEQVLKHAGESPQPSPRA